MSSVSRSPAGRSPEAEPRAAIATAALLAVAVWWFSRPYQGFGHDARLYALQALARLHPESLGQDVFLRFGSQDAFSIFGPLYALAIRGLGLEEAARLLTLAGHAWWLAAAATLAVSLLGPARGLLATALVAALPGYYGAWGAFRYAEGFLTARLLSEAAVLSGLAALARGRTLSGGGFMLMGLSLHPLMGAAGCLVWLGVKLGPRGVPVLAACVAIGTALALGIAAWAPVFPLTPFDTAWWADVRARSPFLSMADWDADSWKTVLVPLAALWIFAREWRGEPAHLLFKSSFACGMLGLAITLIGATLWPVVLLVQGQPWRWTWFILVLAVMAGIRAVSILWKRSDTGRATLALLASSWLVSGWPAVGLALAAIAVSISGEQWHRHARKAAWLVGAAILASSAYIWVVTRLLAEPVSSENAREILGMPASQLTVDGVLPLMIVCSLFWIATRRHAAVAGTAVAAALGLGVLALANTPQARNKLSSWDPAGVAGWQDAIPPDAEVFWPENASGTWLLLRRRSYVSSEQAAGILFSPEAWREIGRRADDVGAVLPRSFAFKASLEGAQWPVTDDAAASICRSGRVDFLVTSRSLAAMPAATPLAGPARGEQAVPWFLLYRCSDVRAAASRQ